MDIILRRTWRAKSAFILYAILLLIPGLCYTAYMGGWLIGQVYDQLSAQNFWLYLPVLVLPFVALAWLLRRYSSGIQKESRWNGAYFVAALLASGVALIAYPLLLELLTIPDGFRNSHKDALFWEIVLALYLVACFSGLAVLSFPKKQNHC